MDEGEKYREKWSRKLSISFFGSLITTGFAIIVLFVTIFVPNTLGVDHKIYLSSVVGVGLLCVFLLLIKARSDPDSLLAWTKVADNIAAFVIGKFLSH